MKTCITCHRELPDESFPFHTKGKPSRRNKCRDCKKEYNHQYTIEHKDELATKARQRRTNFTPEQQENIREAARRGYRKHREERLAKNKEYREQNPQKVKDRIKNWEERNPDRVKERSRRYSRSEKGKAYRKNWTEENREKRREQWRNFARKKRAQNPEKAREYEREYRKRENARLTDAACGHVKRARKRKAPGKFTASDILAQYETQEGKCFWCGCDISEGYQIDHLVPLSKNGTNYPDNIVLACATCNNRRHDKMPDESWEYLTNHPGNHQG